MRQDELVKNCNYLRELVIKHEEDDWEAEELLNAINQLEAGELCRLKKRRKKREFGENWSDYFATHDYQVKCDACGRMVSVEEICDWDGEYRGRGIPVDYQGALRCVSCICDGVFAKGQSFYDR